MTTLANIKYILIGNLATKEIVTEFTVVKNDQIKKESNQIFQKLCTLNNLNYNSRNKLQSNQGYLYFVSFPPNRFYYIVAEPSYPERFIFELIDNMDKDNIFLLTTDKGELNSSGKQMLKVLIDKYQDLKNVNKIQAINDDVESIKTDMSLNIKNMVTNISNVQDLEEKASRIKLNADSFKKDAVKLERMTCWQNFKWTIILCLLIGGIVLFVLYKLIF